METSTESVYGLTATAQPKTQVPPMILSRRMGRRKLTALVPFVMTSSLVACSLGRDLSILGFTVQGYAWLLPLLLALFSLSRTLPRVTLPWYLWTPWVALIAGNAIFRNHPHAWQRTIMMVCPVIVGMAVSAFTVRALELRQLNRWLDRMTLALFVLFLLMTGIVLTGTLPVITGLAPQVMTGALLASHFAPKVLHGSKKALYYWIGLAALPIIALTRTGMVATALTLPLSLAPLKPGKRVIALGIIGLLGLGLFYTERVQKKMFYRGEGKITEVRLDNPGFRTAGRVALWEVMQRKMEASQWWGFGANATDGFLLAYTGFPTHPHNDWLRLRFDYGYVGLSIFVLCILLQALHALRMACKATGMIKTLFQVGALSFLPFVLFMATDNIILYVAFFGNLQFTLLGVAYASFRTAQKDAERAKRMAYRYSVFNPRLGANHGTVR